jgi:hypothetical protein
VVLPSLATTLMTSWVAAPVFMRGGVKVTDPDHTPLPALQVTEPGKTGLAAATPVPTVKSRSKGKAAAVTPRASFRPIFSPPFRTTGGVDHRRRATVFPTMTIPTSAFGGGARRRVYPPARTDPTESVRTSRPSVKSSSPMTMVGSSRMTLPKVPQVRTTTPAA